MTRLGVVAFYFLMFAYGLGIVGTIAYASNSTWCRELLVMGAVCLALALTLSFCGNVLLPFIAKKYHAYLAEAFTEDE